MIKLSKTLKSERKAIKEIEPLMFDLRKKIHMRDDKFYNMLIAVTEAVNNAIIHGNKCNPQKEVIISIEGKTEEIIITIKDHGGGFDPSMVADPRQPENLLKEHGRGIFLMKEISDQLSFRSNKSGTIVILNFKIK